MNLFYKSKPYKIVKGDAAGDTLSHAYLLVCPDEKNLRVFLKEIAKIIMRGDERVDRLIDEERFADLTLIPSEPLSKISVADVKDMTEQAYIKPVEQDYKVFVIDGLHNANAAAQNKLLKILEEPPENVFFVLGSLNVFTVLPTVLSRVKKLELESFSEKDLAAFLKEKYPYREDIYEISAISGGNLGKAEELISEGALKELSDKAAHIALNLNIKNAVEYSKELSSAKGENDRFLAVLRLVFRDMLMIKLEKRELLMFGGNRQILEKAATRYTERQLVFAQDAIGDAERNLKFNANLAMTYETLFIRILEE